MLISPTSNDMNIRHRRYAIGIVIGATVLVIGYALILPSHVKARMLLSMAESGDYAAIRGLSKCGLVGNDVVSSIHRQLAAARHLQTQSNAIRVLVTLRDPSAIPVLLDYQRSYGFASHEQFEDHREIHALIEYGLPAVEAILDKDYLRSPKMPRCDQVLLGVLGREGAVKRVRIELSQASDEQSITFLKWLERRVMSNALPSEIDAQLKGGRRRGMD